MPTTTNKEFSALDRAKFYFSLFRQKPIFPIIFTLGLTITAGTIINLSVDKETILEMRNIQKLKAVAVQKRSDEMNQMRNIDEFYGKPDFVVAVHPLQRERLYTDVKKPDLNDLLRSLELQKEETTSKTIAPEN